MQRSFDWKSVASSAVGAGIGQAVGGALGMNDPGFGKLSFGEQFGARLVTGLAASTGAALARGGKVSIQQVGVDAFGSVLGNSLVDAMGPQPESIYSLSSGDSGQGLRPGASSGTGLAYGGARATGGGATEPVFASDYARGAYEQIVDVMNTHQRVDYDDPVVLAAKGALGAGVPALGSSARNYRNQMDIASDNAAAARMRAAGTDSSLLGATAGVASSLGSMVAGGARIGSNMLMQIGNVLTGGINNDYPMMQQVHAEQRALGQGIVNLVSSPVATATDLIEGVVNRYDSAMAQPTNFDRSYELGRLFNDVGQSAIGGGLAIRGAARLGASGLEFVGENAFASGPAAGGRSAQFGAINLGSPRYQPGVVTVGDDLVPASGRWLDAGTPAPIPLQVARQLEGQSFKTFPELRDAIWQTIAKDPELNTGFGLKSLQQMESGYAPFAPRAFQNDAFGMRFNLHHVQPIGAGGAVYDLSNLRIVSPKMHYGLHYE